MDMVSRIYCESLKLRAYTVVTKQTAAEITSIHKTTPNATLALGRTVNAAALIAATLKPESNQSILMKFSGEGPVREVHVQCDAFGNVRGYIANPAPDITKNIGSLNFSKAIGAGFLTIIKDLGMGDPYTSVTPLLYGEVAADLAYHLTTSEQVPSAVILGLNLDSEGGISSSGGILIQTFPDTDPEAIEKVESNIKSMPSALGDLLEKGENIYSVVSGLFDNHKTEILSSGPVKHQCRCSHDMLLGLMKTVHHDELMDMIETDKGATVTCTFCRKEYIFTEDELKTLIHPA
ncbi:MAG TPA: Hsp33 family molecular chaperone HslO [Spirochaetota bacterium]|nr:Hsp33 family molecular chaperone HslO [Spirochaetota bacterium]